MKFSTNEDVEAPIEATFDLLCDFAAFERAAMRRGAEVQRTVDTGQPGAGMAWQAVFEWRGKRRKVDVTLVTFDRPNELLFESTADGLSGSMRFELISLSRGRTRVRAELEIKPMSLSARLLIQSLKLGKTALTKKYKTRVANFAKSMEDRYARLA